MEVSPACYSHLLSPLMGLAGGKVAVILEGGYCLKSLSEGVALTLRTLLGDPAPSLIDFGLPCDSVVESILNVIYVHKPYWKCFQLQDAYDVDVNEGGGIKTRKKSTEKPSIAPITKRHHPVVKFIGNETKLDFYPTRDCYPIQEEETFKKLDQKLNHLKLVTDLRVPPNRVAFGYDEKMTEHRNNQESNHPEKPERITKIFLMHRDYNLLERCLSIKVSSFIFKQLNVIFIRMT